MSRIQRFNCPRIASLLTLCAPTALLAQVSLDQQPASAEQQRTDVDQAGVQVLTRGPVHEAFASTVSFNPKPGLLIPKAPPAVIQELPPDQRPAGENVAWIPGYWGWDDDRQDYLWVSGIWRDLPPGRQWIPGYWANSGANFQWTSGYWSGTETDELEYLPEPPATVEAGPNIAAPSANDSWIPGSWIWQQGQYAWRAGSWQAVQPNWVWVPDYYVWTPRGFVFVSGYWDYTIAERGVLFAPVYFDAGIYAQNDFFYSPAVVINPAVFASQLFLRPTFGHYYFGDYYAANYANAGYEPWCSYHDRIGYDPLYAHQRWEHRADPQWERSVADDFQYRREHEEARPPRTWVAQRGLSLRDAGANAKSFVIAASLAQVAKNRRYQSVGTQERQQLVQNVQEVQRFGSRRARLEGRNGGATNVRGAESLSTEKRSLSPIVAKRPEQLSGEKRPPQSLSRLSRDSRIPNVADSATRTGPGATRQLGNQQAPPLSRADQPQQDRRGGLRNNPRELQAIPGAARSTTGVERAPAPRFPTSGIQPDNAGRRRGQSPGVERIQRSRTAARMPLDTSPPRDPRSAAFQNRGGGRPVPNLREQPGTGGVRPTLNQPNRQIEARRQMQDARQQPIQRAQSPQSRPQPQALPSRPGPQVQERQPQQRMEQRAPQPRVERQQAQPRVQSPPPRQPQASAPGAPGGNQGNGQNQPGGNQVQQRRRNK